MVSEFGELYFTSQPSTPPSSAPSTPSAKGTGAKLYASYMSELHHRRIRKGQSPPPADAAGLVYGTKFHGRSNPLKGPGVAPPDNNHADWVCSKGLVPGRSFVSVRNLLKHADHTGSVEGTPEKSALMDSFGGCRSAPTTPGSPAGPAAQRSFRTCMKLSSNSFKTGLSGAGLEVVDEEPKARKLVKCGTFAPTGSTARVFCAVDIDIDPGMDVPLSKWVAQLAEAKAVQEAQEAKRPQTAPSMRSQSEARKYYHADFTGHQDVFRYRHSGGICPDEYKFAEVRQSAPALELKPPGSAKEVFFDTRASYSFNRVKGLMSNPIY